MKNNELLREYFLYDTYNFLYETNPAAKTPKSISDARNKAFTEILIACMHQHGEITATQKRYILGIG